MNCNKCYKIDIGAGEEVYTLKQRAEGNSWFNQSGERVVDNPTIQALYDAVDTDTKKINAEVLCSDGAACAKENDQDIESGNTSPIPSGFHSLTIVNLTGITTVNGGFPLGAGVLPRSLSLSSTNHTCLNDVLPEITLSGGTFQWIGVR